MAGRRQRTESEQTWHKIQKAATNAIRLKHTLRAEDELNERLPALRKAFELSLKGGPAFELETADLLREDA